MKKYLWLLVLVFSCGFLFAENSLDELLQGYFENSTTLKDLSAKVKKAVLSSQSAAVSNGMTVELSTGTIQLSFADGGYCTFRPSASLAVPQARNLKFSASSNVTAESGDVDAKNTSLGLSVDIYSGASEKRKVSVLKAERALLVAQRALQNGFLQTETQFYTGLKSLYAIAQKIVSAQKSLYEHSLEFDQIKIQGYNKNSSKYRLKQMEVEGDEHDVQIYRHELEREVKIFARECGIEYTSSDALSFLPDSIPDVKAVDFASFKKEDYVEIEEAIWNSRVNKMTREAEKTFSVSANAGYTFNNTTNSFMTNQRSYGDTVDIGSSLLWNGSGVQADAGISFPVSGAAFNPLYKFSLTISPQKFRLSSIEKKSGQVDEELEGIALEAAEKKYKTSLVSQEASLSDIEWASKTNRDFLETYSLLEADTRSWLSRGIITQSEYNSAQVNKENYRIKTLVNAVEKIIYNNQTKILFNRDQELNHGEVKKDKEED